MFYKLECSSVANVRRLEARGPWVTKSGGALSVLFAEHLGTIQKHFFSYDPNDRRRSVKALQGLRFYCIRGLHPGRIGGTEWHRIREEMVFVLTGSVRWRCEDLYGEVETYRLDPALGLWMPPYILHEYEASERDTSLLIVANTLFDPEDPSTHDTYPVEDFRALQRSRAR